MSGAYAGTSHGTTTRADQPILRVPYLLSHPLIDRMGWVAEHGGHRTLAVCFGGVTLCTQTLGKVRWSGVGSREDVGGGVKNTERRSPFIFHHRAKSTQTLLLSARASILFPFVPLWQAARSDADTLASATTRFLSF